MKDITAKLLKRGHHKDILNAAQVKRGTLNSKEQREYRSSRRKRHVLPTENSVTNKKYVFPVKT